MANYDDFDLDIRKIKGNMEAEPKGTAAICLTNKKWYNQQVGLYVPFKNHFLQDYILFIV